MRHLKLDVALAVAVVALASCSCALGGQSMFPGGKLPLFPPEGMSGIFRVIGDYNDPSVNATSPSVTGWRYSGFQSVLVGNVSRWRYDWTFELPNRKSGETFWGAPWSQNFETGFSGPWPTPNGTGPWINSLIQPVPLSTPSWRGYHLPMGKQILSDYLTTATPVNETVIVANYYPEDDLYKLANHSIQSFPLLDLLNRWQTHTGGNSAVLKKGVFAGQKVKLYQNPDLWFQCPWCTLITAVSTKGVILRQYFTQPTSDFYTDYYEFQQHDPSDPAFLQSFNYTAFEKSVCLVDITTGAMQNWDENGPIGTC